MNSYTHDVFLCKFFGTKYVPLPFKSLFATMPQCHNSRSWLQQQLIIPQDRPLLKLSPFDKLLHQARTTDCSIQYVKEYLAREEGLTRIGMTGDFLPILPLQ